MALVKCKECGAEISSEAKTCPKCGMQIIKKPIGCGTVFGVIFLGIIILASFSRIFSSVTSDNNSHVSSIPATQQTQASLTSNLKYKLLRFPNRFNLVHNGIIIKMTMK